MIRISLFCFVFSWLCTASGQAVDVSGWPLPDIQRAPPPSFGNDPVFGRLVCPPLTRLNLTKGKSEGLLIRSAKGTPKTWQLRLRSGIYWWNGDIVTAQDIAAFLKRELPQTLADHDPRFAHAQFGVRTFGDDSVLVRWEKDMPVGPFVLNGVPLWRQDSAKSGLGFLCAGLYYPRKNSGGYTLNPTPGYRSRRPRVRLVRAVREGDNISFRYAESFGGTPWTRLSDKKAECRRRVSIPKFTIISWNTAKYPVEKQSMRLALEQLIPKRALVESAAGSLGHKVSSLIPFGHPGYNGDLRIRSYSMANASRLLDTLGFRRKKPTAPRTDDSGDPLTIVLSRPSVSSGMLEKVLIDTFSAVGLRLNFVNHDEVRPEDTHGALTSIAVDWPAIDWTRLRHARLAVFPLWGRENKEVQAKIAAYSRSLTHEKPDFGLLKKIHQSFHKEIAFSVVMQHRMCMTTQSRPKVARDYRDPDWFRRVLF